MSFKNLALARQLKSWRRPISDPTITLYYGITVTLMRFNDNIQIEKWCHTQMFIFLQFFFSFFFFTENAEPVASFRILRNRMSKIHLGISTNKTDRQRQVVADIHTLRQGIVGNMRHLGIPGLIRSPCRNYQQNSQKHENSTLVQSLLAKFPSITETTPQH